MNTIKNPNTPATIAPASHAATPRPIVHEEVRGIYPPPLAETENDMIAERRVWWAGEVDNNAPVSALANSGGGIRSATFCLGFMQALAKANVLRRFDILSTVSGGGYIGSFFGAWIHNEKSGRTVESNLTNPESEPLRFLRNNGRYLAPNGAADLWSATAAHLRSWFTVWLVLGVVVLGLLLLSESIKVGLWNADWNASFTARPFATDATWLQKAMAHVQPSPYFAVAGWGLLALFVPPLLAYWLVNRISRVFPLWIVLGGIGYALWTSFQEGTPLAWARDDVWPLVFFSYGLTVLLAIYGVLQGKKQDVGRNRLNDLLTGALILVVAVAVFAVVDTLGQTLATKGGQSIWSAVVLPALAALAQWVVPHLTEATRNKSMPVWLSKLAIPAAALVIALLAFGLLSMVAHSLSREIVSHVTSSAGAWILGASLLVLGAAHFAATRNLVHALAGGLFAAATLALAIRLATDPDLVEAAFIWKAAVAVGACGFAGLAVAALVGFSFRFVNLSSHHRIYSARLTRTYLGASNPNRTAGAAAKGSPLKDSRDVTAAVEGDNIDYPEYRPHQYGGPLHLINATVNVTVDGISHVEQRDRRGFSLAIGPAGLNVRTTDHALFDRTPPKGALAAAGDGRVWINGGRATHFHTLAVADRPQVNAEIPTLGSWVGISGAAFTTGLGARTSLAISFLLGFLNVRLGYWWDSGVRPAERAKAAKRGTAGIADLWSKFFPAQAGLMEEFFARFHGPARQHWYLSDGGHFENCAVYELIRRRVPLIVCCDCGADPKYEFEDLANLVRKARLDFCADIKFWNTEEIAAQLPALAGVMGELHELKPQKRAPNRGCSTRHAAIAWITYEGSADKSLLLVVKPTFGADAPVDIRQYDATDRNFPQQSTLDQFFDEAQWESYRAAGYLIGEKLFGRDPAAAIDRWNALTTLARGARTEWRLPAVITPGGVPIAAIPPATPQPQAVPS